MDIDGCERRVKNAITNMKGYIVMLALCVYVCVFPLLIEALFCPLDCNSMKYICDNRDERNMIICDMQRKTEAKDNTPIMGLTYYLHKQHIKFLSDAKSNYLSF